MLITHHFKTSWTPSPVATPTKTGMPRRSKGSKHGVMFFIFSGPIFFVGPDDFVLSGPTCFIVFEKERFVISCLSSRSAFFVRNLDFRIFK